jgi:hypothetical protein
MNRHRWGREPERGRGHITAPIVNSKGGGGISTFKIYKYTAELLFSLISYLEKEFPGLVEKSLYIYLIFLLIDETGM